MHWCPRCRGVLLSPAPIGAPAERRNYRWVARRPDHRIRKSAGARPAPIATPRYTEIPRWGLLDQPPLEQPEAALPFAKLTRRVSSLLITTAVLFGLAALGELLRYLVLLRNRTRLIHPALLFASDAFVVGAALLALAFALFSALAMVGWLIRTRRTVFASAGRGEPRSVRALVLGCVVPVVNLIWPGVFLSEILAEHDDPRAVRAVRIWWAAWVGGGIVAAAALLWRTADSLQAKADGVLFTACTDLVAAAVALLTLTMLRAIEERDAFGHSRIARRWVIAVDPPIPVIEPVQPGGRGAHATVEPPVAALDAAPQHTPDGTPDREQEEVMAK